ncbi:hypothetical protein MTR67_006832 [Solanum verrucosum]|uniref:CCHC-type domain-containing protein n=1 Tax=Solanum verrucosum TaxID=315347 RepID=A0AAF0TA19_SOLVR|nr:hypothetical protein MTR67_006832 [Solanum verrucosum]
MQSTASGLIHGSWSCSVGQGHQENFADPNHNPTVRGFLPFTIRGWGSHGVHCKLSKHLSKDGTRVQTKGRLSRLSVSYRVCLATSDLPPKVTNQSIHAVKGEMGMLGKPPKSSVREAKILEFVNLRQGRMSVEEYAQVFTRLSRYAPSIVANPKMKMSKFVSGLSDLIIKECSMVLLENDMDMDHLMIRAQRFEKEKLEERSRGTKRYRLEDDNFSLEESYGQSFYNIPPKFNQKKVFTPKSQGVSGSGSYVIRPTCARCGKKHDGKCLAGTKDCYGCGRNDHKIRDCPVLATRGKERNKIRSDALQARGEQEYASNVSPEPNKVIMGLRNALSLAKGVVIEAFVKKELTPKEEIMCLSRNID